ncbi:hypothetical protein EON63_13370 [archaeon]|nr:MAG: hypothetical protein EON63_13370 [archaeon]
MGTWDVSDVTNMDYTFWMR